MARISGTFTGIGVSATAGYHGDFDVSVVGNWIATVELQRSFDGGSTWHTTDTFTEPVSAVAQSVGIDVLIRLQCTAYTSGTVTYTFGTYI